MLEVHDTLKSQIHTIKRIKGSYSRLNPYIHLRVPKEDGGYNEKYIGRLNEIPSIIKVFIPKSTLDKILRTMKRYNSEVSFLIPAEIISLQNVEIVCKYGRVLCTAKIKIPYVKLPENCFIKLEGLLVSNSYPKKLLE